MVHFASTPAWANEYMWLEVIYQSAANILQRLVKASDPSEVIYRYIKNAQSGLTVRKFKYTGTAIT